MRAIAWHTFQGQLKTRSPVTQELLGGRDGGAVDQELGTSCRRPPRHACPQEHYSGEGNASERIATAERMREGLHYKNERSLAFSIFLDPMQKMFNIYKKEGEEFTENAKLRELFKWAQCPQLQDTIKVLKVCFDMEGIMYTQPANHLTAAVSEFPEYHLTRKVSSSSLEHQGFGEVGVVVTIAMSIRRGEYKPQTKASSCQTDRVLLGITQTGQNCQKKTSSGCWIHETGRRKEVLAASNRFQMLHPSQSSYKS